MPGKRTELNNNTHSSIGREENLYAHFPILPIPSLCLQMPYHKMPTSLPVSKGRWEVQFSKVSRRQVSASSRKNWRNGGYWVPAPACTCNNDVMTPFPSSAPGHPISLVGWDKCERKILPSFTIFPAWAVATNFTVFPQNNAGIRQCYFRVWCSQLLAISHLCQCRIVYFYLKFLETRKRSLSLSLQITAPTALWMTS